MSKRNTLIYSVLTLFLGFITSCVSMSTMQTARVTEPQEVGYSIGGGYINSEIPLGDLDTVSFKAPFAEAAVRYGVMEKLDVGAKITLIGTGVIDAKYQLIGTNTTKFAASVGLGIGYLKITSNSTASNIFDIMVPTYLSYHPAPWLAFYGSPKYVLRMNSYSDGTNSEKDFSHWYGSSIGLRVGKRIGFLLEYSYFMNNLISTPLSQITGGIAIGIN